MANCISCRASNMGLTRTPLILMDGQWYCDSCLKTKKGRVVCNKCGRQPFTSDDHFKTVNGKILCTDCMERDGILRKFDYIKQSFGMAQPQAVAQSSDAAASLGGLRILLDQHLSPGETVSFAVQGNAGEAIACSRSHVYILKSGLAVGSITGRKCSKYPWKQVSGLEVKLGNLYGVLEIKNGSLPTHDPNDITRAKKSDNAVTFLASRKSEFDKAVSSMRNVARG